ncbi:MAG: type II toxin-antitoxin system PemK/MazF family toxin [Chitinophagales bacterium]
MKRSVVTIAFPFSDLSGSKRRPALVIADWGGSDVMLCQITSKIKFDGHEVGLTANDFEEGKLPLDSNVRPNKIFTAHKNSILSVNGTITEGKYNEVVLQIVRLIS